MSLGFYGVGEKKLEYTRVLYNLDFQLADSLKVATSVADFPNWYCVMLIGSNLIDGVNSKFEVVTMSAKYYAYVLADKKNNSGLVHYLKNIEVAAYPSLPLTNFIIAVWSIVVSKIFR